jgi:hypothetical protein
VLADGGWASPYRRPFLQRSLPRFNFRGSLIYVKAVVIARVMSKFAAAYTDAPAEWYDFLSWGVAKGHWPTLPSMK